MGYVDKTVDNVDNFSVIHNKKMIMRIIILIAAVVFAGIMVDSPVTVNGQAKTDIVRFHVRANSNSKEDQELKLKVRNDVVKKLQAELEEAVYLTAGTDTYDMEKRGEIIREYVEENLQEIEKWAKETVTEEGYDYQVKASFNVAWVPEKTYDGILFPAGNYEALTIDIGSGQGDNWWCVIFPPLCLVGEIDEIGEGNRLVLRSKIIEMLTEEDNEKGHSGDGMSFNSYSLLLEASASFTSISII